MKPSEVVPTVIDRLPLPDWPWLNYVFADASVAAWILAALITVFGTLLLVTVRAVAHRRVAALARKTQTPVDDVVTEVFGRTSSLFLLLASAYLAVLAAGIGDRVASVVGTVAFLGLLYQVLRWGGTLIRGGLAAYVDREQLTGAAVTTIQALGLLARLALGVVVLLIGLEHFGVNITALVAGLGVGGVAVALAVQNILGDLFASLSIVLDKPFVVGDFIVVGEQKGTVERIGLKTTRVRSLSGEQLIFANGDLLKSRIQNFKQMEERRVLFRIGVTYQTPTAALETIPGKIREVIEAIDKTRFDRAHFAAYGDFALQFEVVYYVLDRDYNVYMEIQQKINLGIRQVFEREGIEFAYPTQRLYVSRTDEAAD
jgi:small-conductance mechanosensitive channel